MIKFCFIICLLLYFFSCGSKDTPDSSQTTQAASVGSDKQSEAYATPSRTVTAEPSDSSTPVSPRDRISFRLLPLFSSPFHSPEDFRIGKLHSRLADDGTRQNVYITIKNFLNGLSKSSLLYEMILKENVLIITASLRYYLDEKAVPDHFRIGSVKLDSPTEARASVRLFKKNSYTSGEIYLKYKEGGWFISDLQADLLKLNAGKNRISFEEISERLNF